MTRKELQALGWNELDVVLVTGDAYVDHPSFGISIMGRLLLALGLKVGIIAQPDWRNPASLKIFGSPRLCFAISSGNIDSMLNIYTAGRRKRKSDDYSEDGKTGMRPPLAAVVYANLAKQAYPGRGVIIGGIEASLRRIAHYDYWQDKIRPSILLDSKADLLIYGMGERQIIEIAQRMSSGSSLRGIRGTARLAGARESADIKRTEKYLELPSYEEVKEKNEKLLESFSAVEKEMNPYCGKTLLQKHGERIVIIEPPQLPLSEKELDIIYSLPYACRPHPLYKKTIPAYEMIKNSVTAVRGCPGACSFCSISLHHGKFLQSRSADSILCEIRKLASAKKFGGTISDIGGPTANTYGSRQKMTETCMNCRRASCLFPKICENFIIVEEKLLELLEKAASIGGVKNVFMSSGIRTDIALRQKNLMRKIIAGHVSGHLKIAPEHLDDNVLSIMRKNKAEDFFEFCKLFETISSETGKEQYIVPYFISNLPGSGKEEFRKVEEFLSNSGWKLRQVQDFIPLPMTLASALYVCGKNAEGKKITVNKGLKERRFQRQKLRS